MDELLQGIQPMWDVLQQSKKPILLYGMGNGADKVIGAMQERDIRLSGVFASDEFVRGQSFHGHVVTTYAQAKEQFGDMLVLVGFGTHRTDVIQNILRIDSEQELYVPDMEVVGERPFTYDFYKEHRAGFEQVYNMLADEQSKQVFLDIMRYKISGKLSYLMDSMDTGGLFSLEQLRLSTQEVYVDAGAYDGDTICEFAKEVKQYQKIYALEPDKRNYKKLLKTTQDMDRCVCEQAAADSEDGQQGFAVLAGRQSTLQSKAVQTVATRRIDSLAPDATLVKLDIEGNEQRAIAGMQHIMRETKPKIILSAYHKNEDLFVLPAFVKQIQPEYKVFLRRFRSVPAWDINYYFI